LSIIHREIGKLKATLRTATRLLTGYHACALRVRLVFAQVPDVVYIQHENTFCTKCPEVKPPVIEI